MKFRVRFFNFGSPDRQLVIHGAEWERELPDDASGREFVRYAMRLACWPEGPYQIEYEKHVGAIEVAVTVEERPKQLITIWIKTPSKHLEAASFHYIQPIGSRIVAAAWSRLAAFGIYMVCLLGLATIAIGQLYWVLRRPERTKGIAVRVDQGANGAINGNPHETISSRANRARLKKHRWGCWLCGLLDWFKKGHCEDSAGK